MAEPTVTAPSLRDRIARKLHAEGAWCGDCDYEAGFDACLVCQQALYGYARAIERLLADADPTDLGGRTLANIQMLERERDAMQRRTFELAEQVAAARAELPEVLDLLRAVVERCVPAVLDVQDRPIDDLWGRVWHRLGTARPRTKEGTGG